MSLRKSISTALLRKSLATKNSNKRLAIFPQTQNLLFGNYSTTETKSELKELREIFTESKKESLLGYKPPYQSVIHLSFFIRRNRNYIEETIKNYYLFLLSNSDLSEKIIINMTDTILNSLTENSQIINFINSIFPVLFNYFYLMNNNITLIEEINNITGKIIKIGIIYSRQIIENNIDLLFNKIAENEPKNENNKKLIILFICKFIQSSSLFAFNKLTETKKFKTLKNLLENFKDPKQEIREVIYELVYQFCLLLKTRDFQTKFCYIQMIYMQVDEHYIKNIHDNGDIPNNITIFSGFTEVVKKIHLAEPLFFLKDDKVYEELASNIIKARNSKNQALKIEFIKFVPELYLINKEIFQQKYMDKFFDYFNSLLNIKTNIDIRNAVLLTLGKFSLIISKESFDKCLPQLINLLKTLIMDNKSFDKEIYKCLADLLSNSQSQYLESIIPKFDIYYILSKLFKDGLTGYKVDFILSILSSFNPCCLEHVTAIIVSLNVISIIISDEEMKLSNFYESIRNNRKNFISPRLEVVKDSAMRYTRKFINDGVDKDKDKEIKNISLTNYNTFYSKCKCLNKPNMIIYSLILLSHIHGYYFEKDILIFFNDKILPFLLFESPKISQKVLQLILCRFVRIYDEDKNLSYYILNNIIDSIRNEIFSSRNDEIKILALNVLHCKTILLDLMLTDKEYFFSKLIGLLTSNENNSIKEKMIQTIGLLALRDEDNSFYISFLNKNIINILFTISNSDDIIHKENLIKLLFYYTKYLKNLYNSKLVEGTFEILINMLFNYDSHGIIIIDILKILCELLDAKIVNTLFTINGVYVQKFNECCHLLLVICIGMIKEEGVNSTKSEIALNTLYQIIKLHRINIYKDYTSETLLKNNEDNNRLWNKRANIRLSDYNLSKRLSKGEIFASSQKIKKTNKKEENNSNLNEELISLLESSSEFNIAGILLHTLIKGANDESLNIIMNILGFSGAIDPSKTEKFFTNQSISTLNNLEGITIEKESLENNEFKILRYNPKIKQDEEIVLSRIDPSTCIPILSLLKILIDNTQQETCNQIITSLNDLIKTLKKTDENLIDIILPSIFYVMPEMDLENQKKLFIAISTTINCFKNKIVFHLNSIIQLIKNFILSDEFMDITLEILLQLFDNYVTEMEKYYSILIPILTSLIKEKADEQVNILNILTLMTKNSNIGIYLNIILEEIMVVYIRGSEPKIIEPLLDFFEKIISIENTYLFYPIIIRSLIEKLSILIESVSREKIMKSSKDKVSVSGLMNDGDNFNIVTKTLNIFTLMSEAHRHYFIKFLPMIFKNCKNLGILNKPSWEQILRALITQYKRYLFLSPSTYKNKLKKEFCKINCVLGLNTRKKKHLLERKIIMDNELDCENEDENIGKKSQKNLIKRKMEKHNTEHSDYLNLSNKEKRSKNRKYLIAVNQIMNVFSTANCTSEDDWNEWFKSSSKILFEQSPSFTIYYCHNVIDYYFPLIRELYSYAFYSTIKNINHDNKNTIIDDLFSALNSSQTPNDILLTILNLMEFIERKSLGISCFDYALFGKVAYKCKAYAKALYFKENSFLINKGPIEDILELYYELKLPESAVGLLKYVQKNNLKRYESTSSFIKNSQYDKNYNEYNCYIKLHEYKKSLDIINRKLEKENEEDIIEDLRKAKITCLNGLCDWEQLLSEDKYNRNNNKNNINTILTIKNLNDENEKVKEEIQKELLLSKACANLGEWEKLQFHFSKISEILKKYHDLENELITKENEETEEDDINETKSNYDTNSILGDSNIQYLEKLYFNIPIYLTNYESKNISFFREEQKQSNHPDYEENDKRVKNEFISYKDIINNSPSLDFLAVQDEIFNINLYSSLIHIKNQEYNLALEYINDNKAMINPKIKSLLGESYIRGYELLANNQLLFNLEQIIDYKININKDKIYLKQIIKSLNESIDIIGKDPVMYEKFLAIRSLILPIEKEFDRYLYFSKLCRKIDLYDKSMSVLNRMKKKLKINNIIIGSSPDLYINERQIKIELYYNQCLFEKGLINEAIIKSQYLVDILEKSENNKNIENENYNILSRLDDKLKSKIYGNLGIYLQKDFNFNEDLDIAQISRVSSFNNENGFFRSSHKNFVARNIATFNNENESGITKKPTFDMRTLNKKSKNGATINQYLTLSTNYNKKSYKYWQNYAMFNYKYYKFIFDRKILFEDGHEHDEIIDEEIKDQKIKNILKKEESYAMNAVNGFKYSITLGGKNMNKTFQDLLRLIDIFFNSGGSNQNLLDLIEISFNSIDIDVYLNVIPQLICRFDLKNEKILQVLINILIKIGLSHPNALIYSLIVMRNSSSKARKKAATAVLNGLKKHKNLIEECSMFIFELNKCAMLPHEDWYETIEDVSKLFQNSEYNNMVEHLKRLHAKLLGHFDNMYEINFYQMYGSSLKEAEDYIKIYVETRNDEYIRIAWEIYHRIYREISEDYKNFDSISLEYVSPKLFNFKNSNICLPGTYKLEHFNTNINIDKKDENNLSIKKEKMIRIQKMGDTLKIFKTKQHPRKMSMIGTDEKEYMFLLKGHEDLRQDERAMQLFDLVNTIVSNNKKTYNKNLFIITYSVFPLSHNTGLIGWVENCDTLHQLIKGQREKNNILPSEEHRVIYKTYPKFETGTMLSKVETFLEALKVSQGTELYNVIWSRAKNCETWLKRRTNYSRSLAVMSIVGYILGLGDRHPSNLMMNRRSGKIIHIDFGDCFEVAMKRDKFPEKVPFRLTRILIKALEISEIEGTFRIVSEQIMELLRDNKDSLMAILGAFIHDPLISFRLMIPLIMKKKNIIVGSPKNTKFRRKSKKKKSEKVLHRRNLFNKISMSLNISNNPAFRLNKIFNPIFDNNENEEKKVILKLGEEEKEKPESINEEKEKNEKKKLESDERQIFNQYEENDEIDLAELNKIAQIVLDRIQDKLSGTDFNPEIIYDSKSQVDKLIQQATSDENLAQSYLGWCPFW